MNDASLDHAADLIAQADALIVAAGAGMGVDSGLPDFRGTEGFWRAYPALGRAGLDFADVASPRTFKRNPHLAWGFYGHRLALYRRTIPHAGFGLLKRWGDEMLQGMAVFTSNVDGQFDRAGFDAVPLHECHGSLHWLQCLHGCGQAPWPAHGVEPDIDEDECRWLGELPACPGCGALARPNVLMFDDRDWLPTRHEAQARRLGDWLGDVNRAVVVEIGAGTSIPSVRHFSQLVVAAHKGQILRINVRESDVASAFGVGLACGALDALSAINQRLQA